ncbi:hypothetical protein SLA2020_084430 [Shorea laevis]
MPGQALKLLLHFLSSLKIGLPLHERCLLAVGSIVWHIGITCIPVILAFDITTEDFREIELPEKTKATALGALEGHLTVTHPKNEHLHFPPGAISFSFLKSCQDSFHL